MGGQSDMMAQASAWLDWAWQHALGWLTSPAAWSQVALLVLAWGLAHAGVTRLTPVIERVLTPKDGASGLFASLRRFALRFLPLLAAAAGLWPDRGGRRVDPRRLRQWRGDRLWQARLPACWPRCALVRDVLTDRFLRLLGRYVLIPVAALYTLGLLEPSPAGWTARR